MSDLQATSLQIGRITNALHSDASGNLILSDLANPTGITLTQVKNNLDGAANYDAAGAADAAMVIAISASDIHTDTQVSLEATGRIGADTLLQSQVTSISGTTIWLQTQLDSISANDPDLFLQVQITTISSAGLAEVIGRAGADLLLQGKITTISGSVSSIGMPSMFTTRSLTNSDNGYNLICGSAQVATIDTGLMVGFGCAFRGEITFNGTATVTDIRTAGATIPWCAIMNISSDTYDCVGTSV